MRTAEPTATRSDAERLSAALDRAEISELVDRYVAGLDTADRPGRDASWYRRIFTEDVRLSFPISERSGIDGLPEFHRQAKLAWKATHHLSGNHVVDLDGDEADVRVQVIGRHVGHAAEGTERVPPESCMDMGGFYAARAVRTARGWRLSSLHYELVWTSGAGVPDGYPA